MIYCPNCNKEMAEMVRTDDLDPRYKVVCRNCGAENSITWRSPEAALGAWKSRPVQYNSNNDSNNYAPINPYTEFAKEMSLLHEALKAEGFKDAMVDILAKMTPIVWDKVELKRARELHNVKRAARRYGRAVEEKSDETSAESFVREVNADNLLRNQESMDAIVKKGLGL